MLLKKKKMQITQIEETNIRLCKDKIISDQLYSLNMLYLSYSEMT